MYIALYKKLIFDPKNYFLHEEDVIVKTEGRGKEAREDEKGNNDQEEEPPCYGYDDDQYSNFISKADNVKHN